MADVKKIKVVIGTDTRELDKGMNKAGKTMDKFGAQMKRLGGLIAGAFAIDRIARFGKEAIKLASQLEGVEVAFARIAHPGLLRDLVDATRGTVTNLQLMQRAVMASNFRIPLRELANLLEFATKRAQETGESVDYLVNSIVIGIGRKSPLILDNLGISAIDLRAKLDQAGHSVATVMDVAKAVGEIAAEAMEKAGGVIETTAIKMERLSSAWINFQTALGGAAIGSGMGGAVMRTLDKLTKLFSGKGDTESMNKFMEFFETISDKDVAGQVEAVGNRIEIIRSEIGKTAKRFRHFQDLADEAKRKEKKLLQESADVILEQNGRNVALLRVYEAQLNALRSIKKEVSDVVSTVEEVLPKQTLNESLDWMFTPFDAGFNARGAGLASQGRTQRAAQSMLASISANMNSDIKDVTESAAKMGNMIGIQLVTQFANLGDAIGRALAGAEDAMKSLGQAIFQNLGSILMMAGIQSGNMGLVIAGAAIQLGSGIWRGMQGGQVTPSAVSGVNHNMTFTIKGRDLQSTLDLNREYNQM